MQILILWEEGRLKVRFCIFHKFLSDTEIMLVKVVFSILLAPVQTLDVYWQKTEVLNSTLIRSHTHKIICLSFFLFQFEQGTERDFISKEWIHKGAPGPYNLHGAETIRVRNPACACATMISREKGRRWVSVHFRGMQKESALSS